MQRRSTLHIAACLPRQLSAQNMHEDQPDAYDRCGQRPCKNSVYEQVGDLTATSSGSDPSMQLVEESGQRLRYLRASFRAAADNFLVMSATYWSV
jgi:hypothetical protein